MGSSSPRPCKGAGSALLRTTTRSGGLVAGREPHERPIPRRATGGPVPRDRVTMLPVPSPPPAPGHQSRVRSGRDYFVRIAGGDYSVDPFMVGRMVDRVASFDTVRITGEGLRVRHQAHPWRAVTTAIDPAHVAPKQGCRRLRAAPQHRRPPAD